MTNCWPTITLVRTRYTSQAVLGRLIIGDEELATLEPPWRNNERNVSCIPTGEYKMNYLPRSASGKYRKVYHITEVEGRGGILIHNGNIPGHTKGCVLVGLRHGYMAGGPAVLNSRTALSQLRDMIGEGPSIIRVVGGWEDVVS